MCDLESESQNGCVMYIYLVDVMKAICEHYNTFGDMNWDNKQ